MKLSEHHITIPGGIEYTHYTTPEIAEKTRKRVISDMKVKLSKSEQHAKIRKDKSNFKIREDMVLRAWQVYREARINNTPRATYIAKIMNEFNCSRHFAEKAVTKARIDNHAQIRDKKPEDWK